MSVLHWRSRGSPSALCLDDIDEIINGGIASNSNIGRVDTVLAHDGLDLVVVDVRKGLSTRDVQATLVLLPEGDIRRRLVDTDTEALQFSFNDSFVGQGFIDVQHNEYQMARLGNGDDLATSSSTILGSFDNSRQINHLQGGTCRHMQSVP